MFAKYAKYYIDRGLSIIPVKSDKKPAIPAVIPFRTVPASPEQIAAWSRDLGGMGVAVICGALSDLLVVDADSPEAVAKIESLLPEQYEAPSAVTPKGGRHFYFKHAAGFENWVRCREGIDIRTEGGYVLLPPSQTKATPDGKCVDGKYLRHNVEDIKHRAPLPEAIAAYLAEGRANGGKVQDKETPPLSLGRRANDVFKAACVLVERNLSRDLVNDAAVFLGNKCTPPLTEGEALEQAAGAWKRCRKNARANDDEGPSSATVITSRKSGPRIILQQLSTFKSRETNYLMQGRIPMGMFALLSGAGGTGKSTLLTEIACRVSRGDPLPGAAKALVPLGSTIYFTTENQPEEVFRPRAIACRGDLNKIIYARNVLVPVDNAPEELKIFDIQAHLTALEEEIDKIGDVRMVVIDPAISHVDEKVDDGRAKPVRQLIDTVSDFAERKKIATIGVGHVVKGVASSARNKAAGSHQWVDASRVALGIAQDKDDTEGQRRLLSMMKANIFVNWKTLAFSIIDTAVRDEDSPSLSLRAGRVEFGEEVEIDVEAVFNPDKQVLSMTSKAIRLFNNELKNGPRPETEIWEMADALEITQATYKYARRKRGIHAEKIGGGFGTESGKEDRWVLWLPELWETFRKARNL
jgi:putative DNA primase/helicase